MASDDELKVVLLQEFFHYLLAEHVGGASVVRTPPFALHAWNPLSWTSGWI